MLPPSFTYIPWYIFRVALKEYSFRKGKRERQDPDPQPPKFVERILYQIVVDHARHQYSFGTSVVARVHNYYSTRSVYITLGTITLNSHDGGPGQGQ